MRGQGPQDLALPALPTAEAVWSKTAARADPAGIRHEGARVSDHDTPQRDQRKPENKGRPDEPLPDDLDDDELAELQERDEGAHAEQIGDGLFRADDSPPDDRS